VPICSTGTLQRYCTPGHARVVSLCRFLHYASQSLGAVEGRTAHLTGLEWADRFRLHVDGLEARVPVICRWG